jgi:hypothetical protein
MGGKAIFHAALFPLYGESRMKYTEGMGMTLPPTTFSCSVGKHRVPNSNILSEHDLPKIASDHNLVRQCDS